MLQPEVRNAIETNYDEFLSMRKNGAKLTFLKLMKDNTGIGLIELKIQLDELWAWDNVALPAVNVPRFEREFSLRTQRKDKLENLEKKLFVNEIILRIKEKSEDELTEKLMEMTFYEIRKKIWNCRFGCWMRPAG